MSITQLTSNIYEQFEVRPVINAGGNLTRLGGSSLSPGVRKAMEEANEIYADMDDLFKATGRAVAELMKAEAALITSGAAAAMALGTAACMTGSDTSKMDQIPNTEGMRDKVLIQKKTRYKFDRCPTIVGAKLVEFGDDDGTTAEHLAHAIGPDTACVLFLGRGEKTPGTLSLDTVVEVAHGKGVPVLVDSAGEVYPLDYFKSFCKRGADLACYGAKYFQAPNSTGILVGRKDLVDAAYLSNFVGFEATPVRSFGRPFKVDRQEAIGLVVALREWLTMDHEARLRRNRERAQPIVDALKDLPGVTTRQLPVRGPAEWLGIIIDQAIVGKTAQQIGEVLRNGSPRIWVPVEGSTIRVGTHTLREGEEEIVARRLREELTK